MLEICVLRQRNLLEGSECASLSSANHRWRVSTTQFYEVEMETRVCDAWGFVTLGSAELLRQAAPCARGSFPPLL